MKKNLPITLVVVVLLLGLVGYFGYSFVKSQFAPPPAPTKTNSNIAEVRKIDLSTQPEWVQKLSVTLKKGTSANGLKNITFTVSGMPKGMVASLTYVVSYETSNKGGQGAMSTKQQDVLGETTYSKTIDFGTCSTKSCVVHEGVKSVDIELDFTTNSGDKPLWSGTVLVP